jgi:alkaline phosphatase D
LEQASNLRQVILKLKNYGNGVRSSKFSFLTGSCTYINNPEFDRPGKPYGQDSTIFETMAKEKSDFMLWLGDNWYTREIDYYSEWGLFNRPSSDRRKPFYTNLFKAMPHYAIGMIMIMVGTMAIKVILLKKPAKHFNTFWANPSYGENNQAIYTKFTWNDVDVLC